MVAVKEIQSPHLLQEGPTLWMMGIKNPHTLCRTSVARNSTHVIFVASFP